MEFKMRKEILKLIEKDARITAEEIAVILGADKEAVKAEIAELEQAGIIRGYKGIIDWERAQSQAVSAVIEVKVTPKAEFGFEEVARRIAKYPEVESVYLMSGQCDLQVIITGSTFSEISNFVAKELAFIDSVTATSTQFIMSRYKEFGTELGEDITDERGVISL